MLVKYLLYGDRINISGIKYVREYTNISDNPRISKCQVLYPLLHMLHNYTKL